MIAILTSLLGGFMVSYSIGFAGTLLDNIGDILDKIKNGDSLGWAYYVFFVLFILLSIFGMTYQMKTISQ
jgi:H+/Cl- antiporter ClcA